MIQSGVDVAIQWDEDVACDLCGSRDHETLRADCGYDGYRFVRCQCGLMFYSPRYTEDYVIRRYLCAGNAKGEAENALCKGVYVGEPIDGDADKQKKMLRIYYSELLSIQAQHYRKKSLREPDSLFDVGASVGWLMKIARDHVLSPQGHPTVAGVDANSFSAETARREFGLNVRGGTFQDYPLAPAQVGRFHLVTMLDYIEHTYTPVGDLKKLRTMTAPDGVLLLKTFLHELDPNGNYVHPIFHAYHFTEATLRRAITDSGWRILKFDIERERYIGQVLVYARHA